MSSCIFHAAPSSRPHIYIAIRSHTSSDPYRTCARARVMDEIEKVQEQMKADTEALKEKMATMVEAMMSIKEII